MKDFNFFEPYLDKKEISTYDSLVLFVVVPIMALGMIIYPLINVLRTNSLNKHIAVTKTHLESSAIYERLEIVEQKEEKVSEMEEKLSLFENVDKVIESKNFINDLLLKKITNKVPEGVFLKSLSLSSDQIRIQGAAVNNLAVAHLENNLKSDKDFKDIYIPSISLGGGLYNFSINFALETTGEDNIEQDDTKQNGVKHDTKYEVEYGVEQRDVEQGETE